MENSVDLDNIIYPEILFSEDETAMVVFTRLRKRNNGVYYFWDYKQVSYCNSETDRQLEKEKLLVQLHFEVYMIQVMGKIDFKLRTSENQPLFEKDKSQTSEERRLIDKYQISNQSN